MAGLRKAVAEGALADHIGQVKEGWSKGQRDGEADEHQAIPASHMD
jgi:queuine tRNA-ribosyltransferase